MVPPASRRIPRVLRYSGISSRPLVFAYVAFTPSGCTFQCYSPIVVRSRPPVRNPSGPKTTGLGSFHFARRYFENRGFFLFLRLLRCFSSPGSLLYDYLIHHTVTYISIRRVSPFGYLRVKAHLQLTAAFRSLSRPSSAPSAKASTLCSSSLGQHRHACAMHGLFFEFENSQLKN